MLDGIPMKLNKAVKIVREQILTFSVDRSEERSLAARRSSVSSR